ncbi:MAG: glycosyltransferase [Muribaculaceae bacterium]|nr:glycosyltransferase [Muribaculaceae bacterium]
MKEATERKILSVVTVNYNNAGGLERTARSIVGQTGACDVEWIVIDGGSTDGSLDVMARYADMIAYSVSEHDRGVYHAMNKGVDVATGEYLLFLNSGDLLYDNNTVEDFIRRHSTEDVVYGNVVLTDPEGRKTGYTVLPPEPLLPSFFWHNNLCHQGIFFSRRCFETHRYNESLKISADLELVLTLLYERYRFGSFDRFIARYDDSGMSSTPEGKATLEKEFNEMIHRIFADGVLAEILRNFQYQDVDIARMSIDIINSPRWVRQLARIFLYPLHYITKKSMNRSRKR